MVGKNDEYFMGIAIKEAYKAFDNSEVPIGAIIVANNEIIAKGYNQTEMLKDSTAHAEILCLTSAFSFMNSKYLNECTIYSTVEPCAMCAGALKWAQIKRLVFGSFEHKCGYSLFSPSILHPKTIISSNVLEKECSDLMKIFFESRRV